MLTIKNNQIEVFSQKNTDEFIEKCLKFLETHFKEQMYAVTEEAQVQLIRKVINFCQTKEIKKGNNIQRMLAIQVRYKYPMGMPLKTKQHDLLTLPGRDEADRVSMFHRQVVYDKMSNK